MLPTRVFVRNCHGGARYGQSPPTVLSNLQSTGTCPELPHQEKDGDEDILLSCKAIPADTEQSVSLRRTFRQLHFHRVAV